MLMRRGRYIMFLFICGTHNDSIYCYYIEPDIPKRDCDSTSFSSFEV